VRARGRSLALDRDRLERPGGGHAARGLDRRSRRRWASGSGAQPAAVCGPRRRLARRRGGPARLGPARARDGGRARRRRPARAAARRARLLGGRRQRAARREERFLRPRGAGAPAGGDAPAAPPPRRDPSCRRAGRRARPGRRALPAGRLADPGLGDDRRARASASARPRLARGRARRRRPAHRRFARRRGRVARLLPRRPPRARVLEPGMTLAIDVREAFRIHRLGGATSVALQGLSLQVEEGEVVVVLGPSGSGKTTLLRTVAGFDTLSAGVARVLGTDVGALGPGAAARFRAQNLGLLDQHYARALSPDLSCAHTVGLGLELLGTPRAEAGSAAAALLERVGLGDRLDARPGSLSGGEQQRVALCAALAHRPRLLLADEPAGELDEANAKTVYALIDELVREQGTTALVVSHDEAAASIADRLVYVRDGRVVEEGRPGRRSSLVVTAPGWVRLPDPLLDALGHPTRLHAEARERELVLASDELDRNLELPAPALFHEHAAAPGEVVAELRGVVKRFNGRAVLGDLSASFRSGTLTTVVGRSGSGKTTLLHLLAGLDRPSEGNVFVAG